MLILLIDDDVAYRRVLRAHLERAEYDVRDVGSAQEGLDLARQDPPNIILLDVNLPDMDGRLACARLREVSRSPIIILSVLGAEGDIVRGLYAGADDYMAKPFSVPELLARIRVQLRRARARSCSTTQYTDSDLHLDTVLQRAVKRGERVYLSRTEFRLLGALLAHRDQVVDAETLCNLVWEGATPDPRRLSVYISYLRHKLEDDPAHPRYIHTARGRGYWFGAAEGSAAT